MPQKTDSRKKKLTLGKKNLVYEKKTPSLGRKK